MDKHEIANRALDGRKAAHIAPYAGSEYECLVQTLENLRHWAASEKIDFVQADQHAANRFLTR